MKIKKTMRYGEHSLTLETGEIARQSHAAVLGRMGDTVVLATVVANKAAASLDFFPLTVHYLERGYAGGMIPGGFLKREGRPSEREILISRLIDRPLRPLFPEGFHHEVQVIVTVLSLDPEVLPDILAMITASAALSLSGIPFHGPIAAARVGYQNGIYLLNPSAKQLVTSELDLVVAGSKGAILMVESEAQQLSEEVMLGAVLYGHEMQQAVIHLINELVSEAKISSWAWEPSTHNEELTHKIANIVKPSISAAYQVTDKLSRKEQLQAVQTQLVSQLNAEAVLNNEVLDEKAVLKIFSMLEKRVVRDQLLTHSLRIDGRNTQTVRPITINMHPLPRPHGSALFTRGETQALVVLTLGTEKDAQLLDSIHGQAKDKFLFHYNFPPYATGEVGMMSGVKRREIGHGNLARRALSAVLPREKDFPYMFRLVSEITESNGSSSMASVCGGTLALMDAGVPISAPVAGIAMGLVKEGDRFVVLTDILGDEDHLGDMDFKVAGTQRGITALQMDIKIEGITKEIMQQALEQALTARLHILEVMNRHISQPRDSISEYAPRIVSLKINPDKIRDVIGKGGATIRSITEETSVNIEISDDGTVKIFSADENAAQEAVKRIEQITAEIEIGKIYKGKVARIVDFGAFVTLSPGRDGLLHISQLSDQRVRSVTDVVQEGQEVMVKVLDIDRQGKIKLSMKPGDIEGTTG